ncbi:MAG: hypothetical protein QM820_00130 [Minicystis sp.]
MRVAPVSGSTPTSVCCASAPSCQTRVSKSTTSPPGAITGISSSTGSDVMRASARPAPVTLSCRAGAAATGAGAGASA